MRSYIGLIRKDADGDFDVSFPDFPGLTAAATSLNDARAVAEEALGLHFAGLAEAGLAKDGAAIADPATLDEIMSAQHNRDAVAILISVRTWQPRVLRVNVTMPEDVLARLDRYAEVHGFTRSGLLTQAAKRLLASAP